jgi:biopolymer transport protein ExbB/TolQ
MAITPSQKSSREWSLLFVALLLVAGVCVPLWWWTQHGDTSQLDPTGKWSPERIRRLFIGPEQVACYCFFTWAGLILLRRSMEVRRQRQAFQLELLPTEEGARILPEDARPLLRKLDTVTQRRPYVLAQMIRLALGKYAISHSAPDVGEVVRTQADVEQGRLVSSMATVQYLTWAIPALGFLGTVRGLAASFTMAASDKTSDAFIAEASRHLNFAFDCTLIALALSLVIMYFLHNVQRSEETLIIDCQQYCQEHMLLRLYDPHAEHAELART